VPETTFVEIVHNAMKFVPFTGLEVTSDFYYDVLSTLITPVNNDDSVLNKSIQKGGNTTKGDLSLSLNRSSFVKRISVTEN
jgi:hypothetical protein